MRTFDVVGEIAAAEARQDIIQAQKEIGKGESIESETIYSTHGPHHIRFKVSDEVYARLLKIWKERHEAAPEPNR